LGIIGDADRDDGITFTDHLGRPIGRCGQPLIPDRSPPKPPGTYDHPTGERMDFGDFTGWIHPDVLRARRSRHHN